MAKFKVGDRVLKSKGDYHLAGEVVAAFATLAGKQRYVVEHYPAAPGLLHIYGEAQLEMQPTIAETFAALREAAAGRFDGIDAARYVAEMRGRSEPNEEP